MFSTIVNAWKIADLRKKILYTLMMLIVFRFGSYIPVPGINSAALESLVSESNSLFGLYNTLTGGAFANATIFAMSITPYINSSIIMQLLTVAIPALERLSKEGDEGRKKIAQYTRYLTVVLAFVQATGLYFGIKGLVDNPGIISFIIVTFTFTAGTAFLMWLGEKITDKGIGNGISLLIFAGIVSRGGQMIDAVIEYTKMGMNWLIVLVLLVAAVVVVGLVVMITNGERRIPVQYAKRVVGRKMYGGQSTHIPIKVSMAGVIPIIFAMSILSFPATIAQFFGGAESGSFWGKFIDFIGPTSWFYGVFYFILIIFFTYFYTAIQFNPIEIANNMKKNGGFVPGIRPGKPTSDYISTVLSRITLVGAIFLGLIAVLPIFMTQVLNLAISFGGTSLLIVVGVALETVKQLESQMLMRHYKGFLE